MYWADLRRETREHTLFFWMLYCLPDLNRNPSTTSFVSLCSYADLIIVLDPHAFSRRFPWHLQGRVGLPPKTHWVLADEFDEMVRRIAESIRLRESNHAFGLRNVNWCRRQSLWHLQAQWSRKSQRTHHPPRSPHPPLSSPPACESLSADSFWTSSPALSAPPTLSHASSDPASQLSEPPE